LRAFLIYLERVFVKADAMWASKAQNSYRFYKKQLSYKKRNKSISLNSSKREMLWWF